MLQTTTINNKIVEFQLDENVDGLLAISDEDKWWFVAYFSPTRNSLFFPQHLRYSYKNIDTLTDFESKTSLCLVNIDNREISFSPLNIFFIKPMVRLFHSTAPYRLSKDNGEIKYIRWRLLKSGNLDKLISRGTLRRKNLYYQELQCT